MGLLGTMSVKLGMDTSGIGSGVSSATSSLSSFAGKAGGLLGPVGTAVIAVGAAVVGMAATSIQAFGDFQQSMLKSKAYAGLTQTQYEQMSNSILSLAPKVGKSPKDLADGLYFVVSAGVDAKNAMAVLTDASKISSSSMTSTETVVKALTSVMTAWGQKSGDAADFMTKAVADGKFTMEGFAGTIGKVGSTAKTAGVSMQQTGAALDVLSYTFPSAAQAGTSLSALMTIMDIKTDTLAKRSAKLGLTFDETKFKTLDLAGQVQYLDKMTGNNAGQLSAILGQKNALQAIQALTAGSGQYKKILGDMNNAQGATNQAFKDTSAGVNAASARMSAAVDVLKIKVGQQLSESFSKVTALVMPLIASFLTWIDKNNVVTNGINFLVGAIKTLISDISNVVTGIQNVTNFFQKNHDAAVLLLIPLGALGGIFVYLGVTAIVAFMAALPAMIAGFIAGATAAWAMAAGVIAAALPFVLIGLAIGALIAIIILVVTHWSQIVTFGRGVWASFASWFGGLMSSVGAFFSGVWTNIQNIFHNVVAFIISAAQVGFEILKMVIFGPIIAIVAIFQWLYDHNYYFKNLVDSIRNFFVGLFSWATGAWNAYTGELILIWHMLMSVASSVWSQITSTIGNAVNAALSWLRSAWNAASSATSSAFQTVLGFVRSAWLSITGIFASAWGMISGPLASLWSNISSWFSGLVGQAASWGTNIIQGFINGIVGMAGNVANAAAGIAQTIADHLGFHSPAKKGPGSTAHLWAPNLINMFAQDILSTAPKAQAAAEQMMASVQTAILKNKLQIDSAKLSGNSAHVKSLETVKKGMDLQLADYKKLLTKDNIGFSNKNINHEILFGSHTTAPKHHTIGHLHGGKPIVSSGKAISGMHTGTTTLNAASVTVSGNVSGASTSSTHAATSSNSKVMQTLVDAMHKLIDITGKLNGTIGRTNQEINKYISTTQHSNNQKNNSSDKMTVVFELDGQELAKYVGNWQAKQVRVKMGMRGV